MIKYDMVCRECGGNNVVKELSWSIERQVWGQAQPDYAHCADCNRHVRLFEEEMERQSEHVIEECMPPADVEVKKAMMQAIAEGGIPLHKDAYWRTPPGPSVIWQRLVLSADNKATKKELKKCRKQEKKRRKEHGIK